MKSYLWPRIWRRGADAITFVSSERLAGSSERSYWFGVYHNRRDITGPYMGSGSEYSSMLKHRISKEFYRACLRESRQQYKWFRK